MTELDRGAVAGRIARRLVGSRVLLVGPRLESGGVSRFVSDLLDATIGYEMLLFNTARPAKRFTARGAIGYGTLFAAGVPWAARNALTTGWNIIRFPLEVLLRQPSLIHIATSSHWSFWESAIYAGCAKLLSRKVVLHYLGDFRTFYSSASPLERSMIQRVFQTADKVFVLSNDVHQVASSFMEKRRVLVVPSSVELPGDQTDQEKHATNDRTAVLFMGGNYGVRKGVNDLIAAIPCVLAELNHVEFWLCGSGDVEAAYQSVPDEWKQAVKYLGWVDDVTKAKLLSAAGIYVLPSYSEGMPYGIIEAMSYGLPVVATSIGSVPEVLTERENGLMIRPGDIGGLADSIVKLARDHALRQRMGSANRERASKLFSTAGALDTIRSAYDSLLETHDAAHRRRIGSA